MTANVRDLLGPGGRIASRLSDYEERPQQLELAVAAERALRDRGVLLAEAGTGVGKSFAYLLPAILHACSHRGEGPVVIATRGIALQEQLEAKDIPFLQAILPQEWSAVTAVGRNNYLCMRRLDLALSEGGGLFEDPQRAAELAQIANWSIETLHGTRMALPEPVAPEVWAEVNAEHGNCLNKACRHYDACHWQSSRRRLDGAQILIVNHAMYVADISLRMAGVHYLPAHRAVVFDEAHHLERVATEGLGNRIGRATFHWHLSRLRPKRAKQSLLDRYGDGGSRMLLDEVRTLGEAFFDHLDDLLAGRNTLALQDTVLENPLSEPLDRLAAAVEGAAGSTTKVDAKSELTARARGLAGLAQVLRHLCAPTEAERENLVRWLQRGKHGAEPHAAPLRVDQTLREYVFTRDRAAILTSATLGTGTDPTFGYLRQTLGIDRAETLQLGSPFDYEQNVEVLLEEALPDPSRNADEFLRDARSRILDHLLNNGGRALVLCTSWHFVRELANYLRPDLADADIELLVQGEAALKQLLLTKQDRPTSVLLGTDSLWEGIDVPGEALTMVIVTRFPFQPPGHPLTEARTKAVEARGGNGFRDYSLPEAVLKFRQGFGRLVRRGSDRGRVVILDPRIRTKSYGREFLRSLPKGAMTAPDGESGAAT